MILSTHGELERLQSFFERAKCVVDLDPGSECAISSDDVERETLRNRGLHLAPCVERFEERWIRVLRTILLQKLRSGALLFVGVQNGFSGVEECLAEKFLRTRSREAHFARAALHERG